MSLLNKLRSIRTEMAHAAQEVYDSWDQDEDGDDPELGSGGICDRISDALASVVVNAIEDVEVHEGGQDGDDHSWLIVMNNAEAYSVDIPPRVYETGGGYSWKKIPDVVFKSDDIVIDNIPIGDVINLLED